MMHLALDSVRRANAKRAFTTRNVEEGALARLGGRGMTPRPGDLVLARVVEINHHKRLELPSGRKASLFLGDKIIVAYGNRYAPDQFEAEIPKDLGVCELVAAGGLAGTMLTKFAEIDEPSRIEPEGLFVGEDGAPVNIAQFALPERPIKDRPPVIAVVGGSMNAGKTTTVACLARAFATAGLRVGAAKVTGTGSGGDLWSFRDAGALQAYDFTDAGLASTYKASASQIERVTRTLVGQLIADQSEIILLEIADGVLQPETARLIRSELMTDLVDGYVYAAESATSALAGVQWLQNAGVAVLGLGGRVSASPLAAGEAARAAGMACRDLDALQDPTLATTWLQAAVAARQAKSTGAQPAKKGAREVVAA